MNFNILYIFLDFIWFCEFVIFDVVSVLFKSVLNIQLLYLILSFEFRKYIVNELLFENVGFFLIHLFIILVIIFFCVDNHWLILIIIVENEVIVIIIYNSLNRIEMLLFKICFFDYVYCLRQRNIYFETHCFRDDVRVKIFF